MELVKRRDYEHYLTSLLLPDKVRQMSFALRALSIEISSIRDNVTDINIGKMRVQFWGSENDENPLESKIRVQNPGPKMTNLFL